MQLDLEGRLIIQGQPQCFSLAQMKGNDARPTFSQQESLLIAQHESQETRWEENVARLRQRVQEVQELLYEDLRDIEEPLRTLENDEEHLSQEQIAQVAAARTRYEQLLQQYHHALDTILLPFAANSVQRECEVQLTGARSSD